MYSQQEPAGAGCCWLCGHRCHDPVRCSIARGHEAALLFSDNRSCEDLDSPELCAIVIEAVHGKASTSCGHAIGLLISINSKLTVGAESMPVKTDVAALTSGRLLCGWLSAGGSNAISSSNTRIQGRKTGEMPCKVCCITTSAGGSWHLAAQSLNMSCSAAVQMHERETRNARNKATACYPAEHVCMASAGPCSPPALLSQGCLQQWRPKYTLSTDDPPGTWQSG